MFLFSPYGLLAAHISVTPCVNGALTIYIKAFINELIKWLTPS
jgi:hypothetical protein